MVHFRRSEFSHRLNAMASRCESLERVERSGDVCAETHHQNQRGQGVGEQMRVDCTIGFGEMREVRNRRQRICLAGLATT